MAIRRFKCEVCGYIHEGETVCDICPVCGKGADVFIELKEPKKGIFSDKNSNIYIVLYSTLMVVIVATILALTALSLKDRQYKNELNEKKQSILSSLGAGAESYDDYITATVINAEGQTIEGADALLLLDDLKGAFERGEYPLFTAADGRVVIPVTGSGLWGPIWGYLALGSDMNSVAGLVMSHKGETPGLGAEIATPAFQERFVGKQLFDGDTFVSITLRKGGAKDPLHEVDGISGGTKTADGVTAMLYSSVSNYLPLLEAKRQEAVQVSNPTKTELSDEQ